MPKLKWGCTEPFPKKPDKGAWAIEADHINDLIHRIVSIPKHIFGPLQAYLYQKLVRCYMESLSESPQ